MASAGEHFAVFSKLFFKKWFSIMTSEQYDRYGVPKIEKGKTLVTFLAHERILGFARKWFCIERTTLSYFSRWQTVQICRSKKAFLLTTLERSFFYGF